MLAKPGPEVGASVPGLEPILESGRSRVQDCGDRPMPSPTWPRSSPPPPRLLWRPPAAAISVAGRARSAGPDGAVAGRGRWTQPPGPGLGARAGLAGCVSGGRRRASAGADGFAGEAPPVPPPLPPSWSGVAFGPAPGQHRQDPRADRRRRASNLGHLREPRVRARRRGRRRRAAAARSARPSQPAARAARRGTGTPALVAGGRGLEVTADGGCVRRERIALVGPRRHRPAHRGLGDRKRHAQSHAPSARRPLGGGVLRRGYSLSAEAIARERRE